MAFLKFCERDLETILPLLFFKRLALVKPEAVLAFLPLKTTALAILPLAMTLTFFAFMAFFMAFIAPFFAFIAFMAFIAAAFFMGSAIAVKRMPGEEGTAAW